MTRKIFLSIMAAAAVVLLCSVLIIMGCLYDYFGGVQERQLEDELALAQTGVECSGKTYLKALEGESYRLTWIAPSGEVLFDSQADESSMENHAQREEVRQALETGEGQSSRYSSTLLEKTIYYAKKLTDGSILRISISRATAGVLVMGMLQPMLVVLAAALILALFLAKRISARIVAPLNRLDLEKPLENDTYEELSPLLTRINQQRRQIDAQLRTLQQKKDEFDQITASMNESLVLMNEKGTVLSINPAARALFHAEPDCVGRDFLTVERSHEISCAIRRALEEGHAELRVERGGREYQLDISRIESEGTVIGAVLLAFDVTEQAFAERNRREFTANVSHELKTPLQSIMGSAELIENGLVKQEDMPRFVGHIRTEAARLVTLIEDIIRLSQLDEGGELPFEPVDLKKLAEEASASLASAAAEKQVTIRVHGDDRQITTVRRLASEIIYNLCDNAVKYNREGGSVDVTIDGTAHGAVVTVQDTGIGIPPEHQSRVFERFYRVDKSHSRQSGGTGLGLSIVKHAVQYLGGRIELESQPGKGTTMRVHFPDGNV
ncbi:MAG: ATP-binding protein [Firmicutes bacterium]|nr:ATP-binding protein [Bacillota bacterium]MDY2808226.1 ATP-binding protein [Oscillospiraceae bacterium]